MGYLAATVNYMSDTIAGAEDDQKKFIANVSHDFRSPLTSIRGYLEAMIDGTIPPEMHEKYLNVVLNETERLTKLTNGLLTLNNLNTKGMRLEWSDFDINKVIRDTAASFEGTCWQMSMAIELNLVGDELLVHADLGRIQQVLYNLTDNAIKYSPDGGRIFVSLAKEGDRLAWRVRDNGVGIPKEDQEHIFERFYRVDKARSRETGGTGLGLSIVKQMVSMHGGEITVRSEPGRGSEFRVTFPQGGAGE
jgi:signal transduction histidine kinase